MSLKLSSNIGIFFLRLIARFPYWMIFMLSNLFYIVVYYIIGYRKKVVKENLQKSFPDKNEVEIQEISKKFFRHFCDLSLEAIKTHGMSESDANKRMIVKNADVVNRYYDQGKSVIVLTMHYNSWEWSHIIGKHQKHEVLAVYKPMSSLQFNKYMNKGRERFGVTALKDALTLRTIIDKKRKNEPVFIWLAADQTPPKFHKLWMKFLNQDTLFFSGPASISKKFNYPLFFQTTRKIKRGHYETSYELLFENPHEKTETEIMREFIARMEALIKKAPEYYLWSHRRWKHKRPTNIPLQ